MGKEKRQNEHLKKFRENTPFFMAPLFSMLKKQNIKVPEVELLRRDVFRPTGPVGQPGVPFHLKHAVSIVFWGRSVAVRTASSTTLSCILLFRLSPQAGLAVHQWTVLDVLPRPGLEDEEEETCSRTPHPRCHFSHCHWCHSWIAPHRNC